MIYLWKIPADFPEDHISEYDKGKGPDRFLLKQGRRLEGHIGVPQFRFSASMEALGEFDDLPNNAMIPLVNERIVTILRNVCPEDVQLIAAQVETNDGVSREYHILNALRKVRAIDHNASRYSKIPGTNAIMRFSKLVLLPDDALQSVDLAREEEYLSHLLVSERLRTEFARNDIRGVGIYTPEQWLCETGTPY